jgi:hypothetical protein
MNRNGRGWLLLLTLVLLSAFALPTMAQDERTELTGDYSVILPEGWEASRDRNDGNTFEKDDSVLVIFDPREVELRLRPNAPDEVMDAAIRFFSLNYDFTIEEDWFEAERVGGKEAVRWDYVFEGDDDTEGMYIFARWGDELYAAVDVWGPGSEAEANLADARAIFRSLQDDSNPPSGEACTVSTDQARTVSLRVGPGFNRTSVAFLPDGEDFDVLGQSSDDEGNLWYQLDKEQAAPSTSANEIWVLSDEVNSAGDCASVVDADAPPIVPITQGGGGSAGGSQGGGDPGAQPAAGGWTITFSRTSNASCAGTGNFVLPTVDMWEGWTEADFTASASLTFTGNGFIFDGTRFTLREGATYIGTWSFADGRNTQMYATVLSSTQIVGQMVGNATASDGTACSASTDFNLTKN